MHCRANNLIWNFHLISTVKLLDCYVNASLLQCMRPKLSLAPAFILTAKLKCDDIEKHRMCAMSTHSEVFSRVSMVRMDDGVYGEITAVFGALPC